MRQPINSKNAEIDTTGCHVNARIGSKGMTTMIANAFRRTTTRFFASLAMVLLFGATPALAVPTLQLGIGGGTYDSLSQTVVASGDVFTLYALLQPEGSPSPGRADLLDTFFLSASVVPQTSNPANLGSFSINSATYNVTSGLVFGAPPVETNIGHDPGDLSLHGVFPTYFAELSFQFNAANQSAIYNTQDTPGATPGAGTLAGTGLYFAAFSVDVRNLAPGYAIHFDLYNETFKANGDVDRQAFAPFSHDAQSLSDREPTSEVPVPASLALVIFGAAFAAVTLRRRARLAVAMALVLGFGALLGAASPAMAVPTLQLDVQGGVYDALSQTIIATSNQFTLYTLLVPDSAARLTHTYYLSAALMPKTGPAPASLGSFSAASATPSTFTFKQMIDQGSQNPVPSAPLTSTTVAVTQDMTFGVPPLESAEGHDSHDLAQHGIFQTYYSEFQFQFSGTQRADVYNSQTVNPHNGPTANANGGLYYRAWTFDVSNLSAGYAIHFDLYNEQQKSSCSTCDIDVKAFAPFSHDAQSPVSQGPVSEVPLPATLVLVILGLGITLAIRTYGRSFAAAAVQA